MVNQLEAAAYVLVVCTETWHLSQADGYERHYRRLTDQPLTPKPTVGKVRPLPPRERKLALEGMKESRKSAWSVGVLCSGQRVDRAGIEPAT